MKVAEVMEVVRASGLKVTEDCRGVTEVLGNLTEVLKQIHRTLKG